ncbi:MAG: hydrolase [Fibrobacteres bacterium]|jgi:glutamate carboxypeptidase|nr:hydrolase [Fibrobacterota bacterium]
MHPYDPYLDALSDRASAMRERVLDWVDVPSGSYDIAGLARMAAELKEAFAGLGGVCEELGLEPQTAIDARGEKALLPLGKALRFRKRPDAPTRVFLGIHYDVVYGEGVTVSASARAEGDVLRASGACDAKGGIAILLHALEAFEASPWAERVGWEVLLNPDEEIGSPGSLSLLKEAAARNHFGLLYEPCLSDGNLVGARKGSGNFAAVMRGRASHAGRDPHLGRNAVHALAEFIVALDHLGRRYGGLTVNVGKIEGGGALNRVPDLAIARFNLRVRDGDDQRVVEEFLRAQAEEFSRRDGYALSFHGNFTSPPKPLEPRGLALLEAVAGCGRELGMNLQWQPSGGVSDGNKLAAAGLPNVDTLGARGGDIHSPQEWLDLNSLAERARLTALLLMKLGSGEWTWK